MQSPFEDDFLNYSAISDALAAKNIAYLDKIFDDATLSIFASDAFHEFLLENPSHIQFYQPEKLRTFLNKHQWATLTLADELQLGLKALLPKEIWSRLANIIKHEFDYSVSLLLDSSGNYHSWLSKSIVPDRLNTLNKAFGTTQVKLRLINAMINQYKTLLTASIYHDIACATSINLLCSAQLVAFTRLGTRIAEFEEQACFLNADIKYANQAVELAGLIRNLFFQNKISPDERVINCIESLTEIIKNPYEPGTIEKINTLSTLFNGQTEYRIPALIFGALAALAGLCLIAAGITYAVLSSGLTLSLSILAGGTTLFASGAALTYSGMASRLNKKILALTDELQTMNDEYAASLTTI